MKKELGKILEQSIDKIDNEHKLIDFIATKLTNIGYNAVSILDGQINIGLEKNLYAIIKIMFTELSNDILEEIVSEINKSIELKTKKYYFLLVCKNDKNKFTNILGQIDKDLYFVDVNNNRVFLIETLR